MIVGDVLAQGCVIGIEHCLRVGGADNARPHGTASVKQQRRTGVIQTLRIDRNIVQAD
jgi:hypothetical protein